MKKCAWCGKVILAGGKTSEGKLYCSDSCLRISSAPSSFCAKCLSDTTEESTGNLGRVNGTGTTIKTIQSIPACASCQSVVGQKWFTILFIPIIPMAKYRVLWRVQGRLGGGSRFLSRRLQVK